MHGATGEFRNSLIGYFVPDTKTSVRSTLISSRQETKKCATKTKIGADRF